MMRFLSGVLMGARLSLQSRGVQVVSPAFSGYAGVPIVAPCQAHFLINSCNEIEFCPFLLFTERAHLRFADSFAP